MLVIFALIMTMTKQALTFHEIAGLGVGFIILIHILFNIQWLKKITLRLFDSQLPGKTRLGYWLNLVLFISLAFTIVSGILISQVLFPGLSNNHAFKGIHSLTANLSLVLVGIHTGLHWQWIGSTIKQLCKLKAAKLALNLGAFAIVLLLLFGGYQLVSNHITSISTTSNSIVNSNQIKQQRNPGTSIETDSSSEEVNGDSENTPSHPDGQNRPQSDNYTGAILNTGIIGVIAAVTRFIEVLLTKKKPAIKTA